MSGFTKHRDEKDIFEMSFALRLAATETLGAPEVAVARAVNFEFVDVTAEVLDVDSLAVLNGIVQFTLVEAASALVQLAGTHRIYVKVSTSQGRILVGTCALHITG